MEAQILSVIITEVKRRLLEESVPRLKKCLTLMTEAEIWYRPNMHTVSAGNLCLHLCGNVRQWVVATLGEKADIRHRQQEFDEVGPIPLHKMLGNLDELMGEVEGVLDSLTPEDLTKIYQVQGFQEAGFSILMHVVEHFSYHVGQVSYIVKSRKNLDLGYYSGHNLDAVT